MKKIWRILKITIVFTALTLLLSYNLYHYLLQQFPETIGLTLDGLDEDIGYLVPFFILEVVASFVIVYYHDLDFSSKQSTALCDN